MILYWDDSSDYDFSEELYAWFDYLKGQYCFYMNDSWQAEKPPKRRLEDPWFMMSDSKRNNKARVTLRRYMALVANPECRKRVFGF